MKTLESAFRITMLSFVIGILFATLASVTGIHGFIYISVCSLVVMCISLIVATWSKP